MRQSQIRWSIPGKPLSVTGSPSRLQVQDSLVADEWRKMSLLPQVESHWGILSLHRHHQDELFCTGNCMYQWYHKLVNCNLDTQLYTHIHTYIHTYIHVNISTTVHAMTKPFVPFCSVQNGESADVNCLVFWAYCKNGKIWMKRQVYIIRGFSLTLGNFS